jgi:hypothetical protein
MTELDYTKSKAGKIKACKQFESYEKVRLSGLTNMLDVRAVAHLSDLTIECAKLIINNYQYFKILYLNSKTRGLIK